MYFVGRGRKADIVMISRLACMDFDNTDFVDKDSASDSCTKIDCDNWNMQHSSQDWHFPADNTTLVHKDL